MTLLLLAPLSPLTIAAMSLLALAVALVSTAILASAAGDWPEVARVLPRRRG